jgi:DNA-binding CsgD family transcriptional regulator
MQRIVLVQTARIEAGWLDGDLEGAMREARNGLEAALRDETVAYIGHFAFWLSLIGGPGMLPPGLPILPVPFDHAPADDPLGASEAYAQRGCPYEAALCLVASDDVALVQRALGELELLGATPAAAVASRRLKELGGRPTRRGPRAATRANPGLLTGREIEVLQLVADGLRNSDIAERLYISAHTAGHHVSSILAKLDARSRSEAVAKGAGLGIVHRAANGEIPHENSEVPPAM